MKVFYTIILILCSGVTFAQPCQDTSYKALYAIPGHKFTLHDQGVLSNGHHFFTGRSYLPDNSISNLIISKTASNGDLLYSRTISFPDAGSSTTRSLVLPLSNDNCIVSLNAINAFTVPDTAMYMQAFNAAGSVLWSKKYKIGLGLLSPIAITELENQNVAVLFKVQLDATDDDRILTGVMKINGMGGVLWARLIESSFVENLEGQSVSYFSGRIYVRGSFIDDVANVSDPLEHRLFAAKFNTFDGTLIASRSFKDLRVQDQSTVRRFIPNYSSQQHRSDGRIQFMDRFENASGTLSGTTKLSLDTNLNVVSATLFKVPGAFRQTRITADQQGETFVYGLNYSNGSLDAILTAVFDTSDNLIRETALNFANSGLSYSAPVARPIGLKNHDLTVFRTQVSPAEDKLEVVTFGVNVPVNPCYGRDTSAVETQHYGPTIQLNNFLDRITPLGVSVIDNLLSQLTSGMTVTKQCVIESECDLLKINPANDTICSLTDTLTFSAHRNVSCLKRVSWHLETSAYDFLEVVDDTTIRVKFNGVWTGKIYASILGCSALKDSLKLFVLPAASAAILGADSALCPGQTILLSAISGFRSYLWDDNTSNVSRNISAPGAYTIEATDFCYAIFRDTIVIRSYSVPAVPQLGPDTVLCAGELLQLTSPAGYRSYIWNTGSISPSISVNTSDAFWVQVTDSCGNVFTDTLKVRYRIIRPPVNLGLDKTRCFDNPVTLTVSNYYKSYLWQDGTRASSFTVTQPGRVTIGVVDSCGNVSRDSILYQFCREEVHFPTAFTPNNDGLNETYRALATSPFTSFEMMIYNRYGEMLYRSKNINDGWNGNFKSARMPSGSYTYWCRYQIQGKSIQQVRGDFLLIR